ncbi:hypothetical protein TRIP_B50728 [uncultured Desulfatiglans sp.]|nr:hypothetical protein TRIP_B50728 [uncultured Desulfatiglans sp.]
MHSYTDLGIGGQTLFCGEYPDFDGKSVLKVLKGQVWVIFYPKVLEATITVSIRKGFHGTIQLSTWKRDFFFQ